MALRSNGRSCAPVYAVRMWFFLLILFARRESLVRGNKCPGFHGTAKRYALLQRLPCSRQRAKRLDPRYCRSDISLG